MLIEHSIEDSCSEKCWRKADRLLLCLKFIISFFLIILLHSYIYELFHIIHIPSK